MDSEIVLTPAALMEFLIQVEELSGQDVGVSETLDGNIQVTIGDSVYVIDCQDAEDVNVSDKVVTEVSDINDKAYDNIINEYDSVSDDSPVEGGILKELVKTLAVGGLVRMGGSALKKYMKS